METGTATPDAPSKKDAKLEKGGDGLFVFSVIAGVLGVILLIGWGLLSLGFSLTEGGGDDAVFGYGRWLAAGGIGLLVLALGLQAGPIFEVVAQRRSLIALNVVVMCLLAVVLCIFVNYISNRHYKLLDWTSEGLYSISDETTKVLQLLEKPIELTLILPGSKQTEIEALRRLVTKYEERSKLVKVRHLDPGTDIRAIESFIRTNGLAGRGSITDYYGVVVQSGVYDAAQVFKSERLKQITVDELYETSGGGRGMGEEGPKRVFKGESMLTGAILEVTEEKKAKLYVLQGHGELDLENLGRGRGMGGVAKVLRQKNYDLTSLKLIEREKTDVPEDASIVIIPGLKRPLSSNELASLDAYLKTGGRLLVMLDPERSRKPGSDEISWTDLGIEGLLKKWNVDVQNKEIVGIQVIPGTGVGQISEVAYGLHLDTTHPITKPLEGLRVLMEEARPLKTLTANPHAKTTELVKTMEHPRFLATGSPDAFMQNGKAPPDADKKSQTVAIAVEQELPPELQKPEDKDKKKNARLVVFGDSDWASNELADQEANLEVLSNTVSWLVGQKRFVAQAKRPHSYKLDLSKGKVVLFQLAAFPGLPIFSILVGLLVWILRRR